MASPDLYWRIIKAAGAAIVELDLDLVGSAVYFCIIPSQTTGYHLATDVVKDLQWPCVQLTTEGEIEERGANGTTEKTDWTYPVRCWIADQNHAGAHDKGVVYYSARKQIMDRFDSGLFAVPEVYQMLVNPLVVFDPALPNYQHIVSGLTLRFSAEETRV